MGEMMKLISLCFLCVFSCMLQADEASNNDVPQIYFDLVSQLTIVKLPSTPDQHTYEKVAKWLRHSHVGNILISKGNVGEGSLETQADRVNTFAKAIFERTGIIPFNAADQEGGRVQHIYSTRVPNPLSIDDEDIEKYATILAQDTVKAGVNLCLGPVLDIPIMGNFIGNRAFGLDPESVIRRASLWIKVLQAHGLLVVGKHFPGHGATTRDTHRHAAYVDKTLSELEEWDLKPFWALLPGLDAVMSGHVLYPYLDPNCIGTYSSIIMTDLLKDFKGLRISDSLGMLAATPEQINFEQTAMAMAMNAIQSIRAGCDVVILGTPQFGCYVPAPKEHMKLVDRIMVHMANALLRGEVSNERLSQALQRVQSAKNKIAVFKA